MTYATGGTVTEVGGYRIHTFTASDDFVVTEGGDVEYLIVAGGGAGGSTAGGSSAGGGGGAGGAIPGSASMATGSYTVTVGSGGVNGGTGDQIGGNGGNSSVVGGAVSETAIGGGGGSARSSDGQDGGSGGGALDVDSSGGEGGYEPGSGTAGQGNDGGGGSRDNNGSAGGGGGYSEVGQDGTPDVEGGDGGDGYETTIRGTTEWYGGGGGGGTAKSGGGVGNGGQGGGGNGGVCADGQDGMANTGGGGGGGAYDGTTGGDGGSGIVIIRYSLLSGFTGVLDLRLSVADIKGVFNVVSPLGTGGVLDLITTLIAYGTQNLRNKLSDDLVQVLRNASGDQSILNLLAGMGLEGRQNIRLQVGTFAAGAHALRNLISGDPAAAAQILRLVIDENNRVLGNQNLLLALKDLAAQVPSTSCSLSVDGKPVRHRILSANVDYSQDGVHNAITITSSDFDLYPLCDPGILYGEQRIELQIGTRVLYFLIEERSGDDRQFSVWGRSLSAREDTPHAAETGYTQDIAEKASDAAEGLLTTSVLDWEAPDWVLPEDFEFHGAPIEGVRQIAGAIGAVARSQDDGSITVRRRYPTRPVDLATASPDVSYSSETDVLEVGYRRIPGTGYNAVTVNGYSPEVFLPDLEVEETSPTQGEDVHVRAYWAGQIPVTPPTTYVTAGSVTKLSDGTGEQTERVVFSGGVGELSYPPESVSSVSWIGANGGTVSWEKHVKTIAISATQPRLASVTYTARFSRYRLFDHDVPELVFTMVVSPGRDASVRVKMGLGDREALGINEPLLTDKSSCVERGRAFLDDSRYDAIEIDIVAPYQDAAVDGAVVSLDQADLSLTGNALIVSAGIEIQGLRIINRLKVRKWAVS